MSNSPKSNISPLIEGYKKFREKYFLKSEIYSDLVEHGQNPKVMVIACSDSRVDPAIITSCHPGDLFIVRNVANLVPPFEDDLRHHGTSAALEFAVLNIKVTDIIVFGHSHCGGIKSLMDSSEKQNFDFINEWMDIAKPAKDYVIEKYPDASNETQIHHCEQSSLLLSLNNLKTFPWIMEKLESNTIAIHAWYFNLKTGVVESYNAEKEEFIPLKDI